MVSVFWHLSILVASLVPLGISIPLEQSTLSHPSSLSQNVSTIGPLKVPGPLPDEPCRPLPIRADMNLYSRNNRTNLGSSPWAGCRLFMRFPFDHTIIDPSEEALRMTFGVDQGRTPAELYNHHWRLQGITNQPLVYVLVSIRAIERVLLRLAARRFPGRQAVTDVNIPFGHNFGTGPIPTDNQVHPIKAIVWFSDVRTSSSRAPAVTGQIELLEWVSWAELLRK